MTIGAFKREDALSVRPAAQAKAGVWLTVFASQRRVARRMTIQATWMHEHRVRRVESRFCLIESGYLCRPLLCSRIDDSREGVTSGEATKREQKSPAPPLGSFNFRS